MTNNKTKKSSRETDPEMTWTRNWVVKGVNMLAAWGFIYLSLNISESWTYTQYVQEDTVMYENDKKKLYKEDQIKFLEMKNTLNGINNRQDSIEEKIRKYKDTAIKILQNAIQRAKLLK